LNYDLSDLMNTMIADETSKKIIVHPKIIQIIVQNIVRAMICLIE
jgi:hypothetical protein